MLDFIGIRFSGEGLEGHDWSSASSSISKSTSISSAFTIFFLPTSQPSSETSFRFPFPLSIHMLLRPLCSASSSRFPSPPTSSDESSTNSLLFTRVFRRFGAAFSLGAFDIGWRCIVMTEEVREVEGVVSCRGMSSNRSRLDRRSTWPSMMMGLNVEASRAPTLTAPGTRHNIQHVNDLN